MIKLLLSLILSLSLLLLSGCSKKNDTLRIAASPVPHAEMLEYIKQDLKDQGIELEIIVTDDYNTPNRALANKEVDANFFQHQPFLDAQVAQFHYPLQTLATIEIEPMGIYSKKIHHLDNLRQGAQVALPNDPTNEARALLLLQKHGLLELDDPANLQATEVNIIKNPKKLKFIEIDAAMLPRTLEDVEIALINTNYALTAGLSPLHDALALEDAESPYANVLVTRQGEQDKPDLQALKTALTSQKMRDFILSHYKGAVLPTFHTEN